ncbi:MAG: transposase [Candidatus Hydrogenedentes bacterium]|nr:transposase [Candidatus Hydrogenedentota bacterium]
MKRQRKQFSGAEKVTVLGRHFLEGVAVSALCGELGLAPAVLHRWRKEFFENGALRAEIDAYSD